MITAADIMTEDVTSIRETASLSEALEALQDLDVRHLPVTNALHEVVGIVSDRDVAPINDWPATLKQPVSRFMSSDVITVDLQTPIEELVDLLVENKVGALPVLDGDRKLAGVVSYIDVLNALSQELRTGEAPAPRSTRAKPSERARPLPNRPRSSL